MSIKTKQKPQMIYVGKTIVTLKHFVYNIVQKLTTKSITWNCMLFFCSY